MPRLSVEPPLPTYPSGRRCTHTDANNVRCITVLCKHNPGPDCFIHSAPVAISGAEARDALEQLMSELPVAA